MTSAAQGWVLLGILGVLSTGLVTVMGLTFAGLRGELEARFATVDRRFDNVDRRFNDVDRRLDNLRRDVQALTDRVFRDPSS